MKKESHFNLLNSQNKRRRRKLIVRFILSGLIFLSAVTLVIWIVFYSPIFKFNEIVIKNIENEKIKEDISDFFKTKLSTGPLLIRLLGFNNFLAWPKSIDAADLKSLPTIADLKITREYNENALIIEVSERQPFAIWCLNKILPSRCFWFDETGEIFKESLTATGNLVQVVSDYSQDNLTFQSKVLPDELNANLISILKVLESIPLDVQTITLEDIALEEIKVQIRRGPIIYFSLARQADNFKAALKSLVNNPDFKKYQYIDLRSENRIYYQ